MAEAKKNTNKRTIHVGDEFITNCHGVVEVIYYNHANDIGVRFSNGYERSATSGNLQKGKVKDPTSPTQTHARRKDCEAVVIGKSYVNKDGYEFTPTKYYNASKTEVTFKSGYVTHATSQRILSGSIRDYLSPTKLGVGVIGAREYGEVSDTKEYIHWSSMLARTIDEKYKKNFPSYKSATVCDEWLNFKTFQDWARIQIGFDNKDFVLDKDVLVKGNKHYSPSTCMFMPYKINNLFTKADTRRGEYPIGVYYAARDKKIAACLRVNGKNKHIGYFSDSNSAFYAYKKEKEIYIQSMAEVFKTVISEKCYKALYDYKVEISD